MPFEPKDVKLLWCKAAGRCSMPDCRRPLVADSENLPETLVLGEMAHIVGEKNSKKSPRGLSSLRVEDRNRYPNLILLCAHHHTVIDKDIASWPIERLHVVKRDHEIWIEEQLGGTVDQKIQIYQDFIDRVAMSLQLEKWEWVCDCLFRQIMHIDYPDGIYQLDFELFRANLPGLDVEFEDSLKNLVQRARVYLDFYMSDASIVPGDPRIMNSKRYKDVPHEDFELKDKLIQEYNLWERNCTMLLFNFVRAINEFSEIVRRKLRPEFFLLKGKFCVHDFMGLMGGSMIETWHLPDRYFSEEELSAPLKRENR
jgi:hypothetical protein